jgi:DNA-binding CsgD family transcriptional regulator
MSIDERLLVARAKYETRAWNDAYSGFAAADRDGLLDGADLERLAIAAHLLGRTDEAHSAGSRAHLESVKNGDVARASRAAIWLGLDLLERGEFAQGSGWIERASRLIDETAYDGPECGYLLVPRAIQHVAEGDIPAALVLFESVAAVADRFGDADLAAIGQMGRGRALITIGDTSRGVPLLDEAMVKLAAGEVSTLVAGMVYCSVIEVCHQMFDLRRAQEWTAALSRWFDSQPDLVAYRGQCLIYRSELMRFHGDWDDAFGEAERARDRLMQPPPEPAVAEALYQLAEIDRLRGAFVTAEASYREASGWGHSVEPGLALLRLAQGDPETAARSVGRALAEAGDQLSRAPLLEAQAEISLVTGDVDLARESANQIRTLAEAANAPFLRAMAERCDGSVRLAEGDPEGALSSLRRAWASWRDLAAPYDAARVRVVIGRACKALGDTEGADLEFGAALRTFRDLGARPAIEALQRETAALLPPERPGGLSAREVEILRLVAAGMTNRAIAEELTISERTVDRHVSNIFTKLDVSTRSAATAFAYEHGLTG